MPLEALEATHPTTWTDLIACAVALLAGILIIWKGWDA